MRKRHINWDKSANDRKFRENKEISERVKDGLTLPSVHLHLNNMLKK